MGSTNYSEDDDGHGAENDADDVLVSFLIFAFLVVYILASLVLWGIISMMKLGSRPISPRTPPPIHILYTVISSCPCLQRPLSIHGRIPCQEVSRCNDECHFC